MYSIGQKMKELCTVNPTTACWEWQGVINKDGYGTIRHRGVKYLAHRLAYMLWNGKLEADMVVLHKCDNPPCINPEHLTKGTQADNIADKVAKGRQAKKLTPELQETIFKLYQEGLTRPQIMTKLGISYYIYNQAIPHKSGSNETGGELAELLRQIEDMRLQGYTAAAIAKSLAITVSKVRYLSARYNLNKSYGAKVKEK